MYSKDGFGFSGNAARISCTWCIALPWQYSSPCGWCCPAQSGSTGLSTTTTGESGMSSSQDRWVWHVIVTGQVSLTCCCRHETRRCWHTTSEPVVLSLSRVRMNVHLAARRKVSATSFVGYIRINSQDCWISPFRQKDWFCVAHKWVKLGVCILMYQNIANQNYQ